MADYLRAKAGVKRTAKQINVDVIGLVEASYRTQLPLFLETVSVVRRLAIERVLLFVDWIDRVESRITASRNRLGLRANVRVERSANRACIRGNATIGLPRDPMRARSLLPQMTIVKEERGSFADALIAALGAKAGRTNTVTFDHKASRLYGFALLR